MSAGPRIAFIGAGSTVFMRNIVGDLLQHEGLEESRIALMDIDERRLAEARTVAERLVASLDSGASVSAHDCQRAALDGADFVIIAFQIAGYRPGTITDFEIPRKFGLRQTIGDTLGIGGIMRGLRTVPALWRLCADMEELCPDALLLQYVNPMAINCWAISARYPDIRTVGLCHSVQCTISELAEDLDIARERIRFRCAGINHMAFYLQLEEIGESGRAIDLYPRLREGYSSGRLPKPNRNNARCPNFIRYEVMRRLGYFATESSEHFAEYVPWFIKDGREDLIDRFGIPIDEYLTRCVEQIEGWEAQYREILASDALPAERSHEYASDIINSIWTGASAVFHGNVRNDGLISSLQDDCVVEVPCLVDRNGVQPVKMGRLPPQLAALMRTNINVQELTVAALTEENREHVYHAAMLDPHTAAELDLDQICNLVDELIEAHRDWLPTWLVGTD